MAVTPIIKLQKASARGATSSFVSSLFDFNLVQFFVVVFME
jgi:hypothetical protein